MYNKKSTKIRNFLKKNFILISIITILFLIFLQKTDFAKNIYFTTFKSHTSRFIKAYENNIFSGFCRKQSHGYIAFIKYKFSNLFTEKKIPTIINFDEIRRIPYWIFLQSEMNSTDQYLILLNTNLNKNFDFSNYQILDNFENRCYFLRKK